MTATPSPIFCRTLARRAANSSFGSSVENSGGCADTVANTAVSRTDAAASRWRFIAAIIVGDTVPFRYPPARVDPLVETLHGVAVPDPFRWLEDADSGETRAWVEAQNALTRSTLDGPARDALAGELTRLFDYPRTTGPQRRGARYFFSHNPGLLNQPVLYVRHGRDGRSRVLIDPNGLSEDGTTALTASTPSPDGTLVAYAVSEHGSDRQT